MNSEIRDKLDSCSALQNLIHSPEWASDAVGIMARRAISIILSIPGVTVMDAIAYLEIYYDDIILYILLYCPARVTRVYCK